MDVLMPQLGETVDEGTVSEWFKKPGDEIKVDEPLLEVETDKVTTEVPALAGGVLSEVLVAEGETVAVGTRLAVIETGDGAEAVAPEAAPTVAPVASPPPAPAAAAPHLAERTGERQARLSPVVRRLIAEHGIDPAELSGSGGGGRITRGDVLAFIETVGASGDRDSETVPFDKTRKRTAEHMVRSKATSPHVLQAVEVDFHNVDAARTAVGAEWKAEHGFTLTYLPIIARAACLAIADHPRINSSVGDDALIIHKRINLAIAVDLDGKGLVAPVIKDAGQKSVAELALAIRDLAARARDGKLAPDDMTEGTYTISNSGGFGTLITAPIINQPQVAILSTDGIAKKPVVIEGEDGDEIVIHPVGVIAQSFDHRAIDGAYSASFLKRLREIIEGRDWRAELG